METAYYNLSGGVNLSLSKTELGTDVKKIYWADSQNVEILNNRGIIRQKGNTLFSQLPDEDAVTGLFEMSAQNISKLIITTASGKIYLEQNGTQTLLDKTLTGQKPHFAQFLNGVLVITESDGLFYITNSGAIVDCNLNNPDGDPVTGSVLTVYRGRVWVAQKSRIYYSALGTCDDFETEGDAGYFADFHTDTDVITAMKPYMDYLAIYKKDSVYLLTGISQEDFAIVPFADKGTLAPQSVVNVQNKQYFLSTGIFPLEQNTMNQIQLGSEISLNIKPEFEKFAELERTVCLPYDTCSQVWYFIPYVSDKYLHTVWINDYVNKAWYKRVIPQDITCACVYKNYILTGDKDGKIYREDFGTSFCGEPVEFMWKSPFLSIGKPHYRKTVDEFYFLLDEEHDNDFEFSIYKDYDTSYADDKERIHSYNPEHFIWGCDDDTDEGKPCRWPLDEDDVPVWAVNRDALEKAEISGSNYAVQLCVSGEQPTKSCAIIGLQFREIYNDD